MTIDKLIKELQELKEQYGNLDVVALNPQYHTYTTAQPIVWEYDGDLVAIIQAADEDNEEDKGNN